MKLDRSKNTARNMIFGTVSKIYNLAIPFVMRTLLIYTLGMAYTGLNSLFTSILSVLNLAELGVGAAMTFSMYKPIAEDDTATVCALMQLYKIYYRVIGLVILVAGTAVFYQKRCSGGYKHIYSLCDKPFDNRFVILAVCV